MNDASTLKNFESLNENIYSKHVAEVLWSRDGCDFPERLNFIQDSTNNFSEAEGSLSSSSWGFDDYEVKSVKKVTSSLDAIEETFYTGNKDPTLSDELHQECQKWAQAFPHLRLKGKQLLPPSNCDGRTSVAEQNNERSHIEGTFKQDDQRNSSINFAYIKEKVIEKLAFQIWTSFIYNLKIQGKTTTRSGKQTGSLPPIINGAFSPPRTKCTILSSTDFPKLEGILTVSPKILLSRSDERYLRTCMPASPETGLSVISVLSTSPQNRSSSHTFNPESILPSSPVKQSNGRILDIRPFGFLHPKDEDLPYRGLQGLHIDPERKDIRTCYFPHESSLPLSKPSSFLPPIEDKTHSFHPLTDMNRPISYQSRIGSGKSVNHPNLYTRHLIKINSRPSTSKMKIVLQNADLKSRETSSIIAGHGKSFIGDNNLVNLLPIVSSKELTEKKRNFNCRTSTSSAYSRRGNS